MTGADTEVASRRKPLFIAGFVLVIAIVIVAAAVVLLMVFAGLLVYYKKAFLDKDHDAPSAEEP